MGGESREDSSRERPEAEPADASGGNTGPQNSKERLYDKIPVTYRQVDLFVKIMIAVLAVVLIIGIAAGAR